MKESEASMNIKTYESRSLVSEESKETLQSAICRICLESNINDLILPCNCKGSHAFAHSECIKTWILFQYSSSNKLLTQCEICNTDYSLNIKFSRSWELKIEDQEKRRMFNFKIFILGIYFPILSLIPFIIYKFCAPLISSKSLIKLLIFLSAIPAIIIIVLLVCLIISTFYLKKIDQIHVKSVSSLSEMQSLAA